MDFSPGKASIITFSATLHSPLVRLLCYPTFDVTCGTKTWHVPPKIPRLPPKHWFPFFQEMSCKLFWTPLPHLHYVLATFHEPNGKKFGKLFLKNIFTDRKVSLGTFRLRPLGNWQSNTYVMYHYRVLLTDFFRNSKYKKSKGTKAVLHLSLLSSFLTVCNRFTNCETRVIGKPTFWLFSFSQSVRST